MSADILFVDDENAVLNSLRRVFHGFEDYHYYFAASPLEALEVLAQREITVLISDHQMPQMTGAEFLARVKNKRPDTIRMLLTGQADLEAVQSAVNRGEIFRFFLKPWKDDDLRAAVRQAVEFHELVVDNRRLMEVTREQNQQLALINSQLEERVETRTAQLRDALLTARALNEQLTHGLFSSNKALFNIIRFARPELGSHSRRVADHCIAVGASLGLRSDELIRLEIAALLHDSGKMALPSFIVEKHYTDFTPQERDLYRSHPVMGAEFLRGIEQYDSICQFISSHHERYNGSGFPRQLEGSQIPREAYLIGILNEYDHLMNRPRYSSEFNNQYARKVFAEYPDRDYPRAIVEAVLDYLAIASQQNLGTNEAKCGLAEVLPQMVLARDVYSMSGHLLLSAGSELTAQSIARLRAIVKLDPIAGEITIQKSQESFQPVRN